MIPTNLNTLLLSLYYLILWAVGRLSPYFILPLVSCVGVDFLQVCVYGSEMGVGVCVCMYCVGLMASFVHRVTELNVRQLSLASVMMLIAII